MPYTSEQVKIKFKREGKSFVAWSAEHGFKYHDVIRVLNGFSKAQRGTGHNIAVKLGMKAAN